MPPPAISQLRTTPERTAMRWTQQSPSRAKARTGLTWMFLACPAWFLVGCGQNEQTPNESSVGGSSQATSQSTSAVGGATNKANVGGNASGSSQANSTQGGRGNSAVGSTDQ